MVFTPLRTHGRQLWDFMLQHSGICSLGLEALRGKAPEPPPRSGTGATERAEKGPSPARAVRALTMPCAPRMGEAPIQTPHAASPSPESLLGLHSLVDFICLALLVSCPRVLADRGGSAAGREGQGASLREQPPEGDASLAPAGTAELSRAELPSCALARCGITEHGGK